MRKLHQKRLAIYFLTFALLFIFVGAIKINVAFAGDDEEVVKTIGGRVKESLTGLPVISGTMQLYKVEGSANLLIDETEIRQNGTYIFKELNLMNTDMIRIMAYPSDVIENDLLLNQTPVIRIRPELVIYNTFSYDVYVDWQVVVLLPKIRLFQNYPNPFNPFTIIEYEIPFDAHVNLSVYDASGKIITTLVNNHETQGLKRVSFNGHGLPSGVYFCKISVGSFNDYKLMTLLK